MLCDGAAGPPYLVVRAQPGDVASIVGEDACQGATVQCAEATAFAPGCTEYHVAPTTAGHCKLTIARAHAGSFVAEVEVTQLNDCQGHKWIGAVNGNEITLPAPPSDAGMD